MEFWFLLLLGLFTYIIVRRSVAGMTRTPVWLLWLVLMTPALIWSIWMAVYGPDQPLPIALAIGPFVICPVLYWLLIQWGRRGMSPAPPTANPAAVNSNPEPTPEPTPVRPIEPAEEAQLRDCFPWSTFYIHNIEYRPQAVICRGQLRTSPTDAYEKIRRNIENQFGDRFLVLLQEGLNNKPFFALVPNPQARKDRPAERSQLSRPFLAVGLVIATLFTTAVVGVQLASSNNTTPSATITQLHEGLPYAIALLAILGIHEMGHYLTARFHKILVTLPYFIPIPFFPGTFGAFIQMRSPVPNRKALFDVSIAGPVAGFVATLPLLIWGLANSQVVPIPEKAGTLDPDALNPGYSILLAVLSKLALGAQLTADKAIDLHPVAIAGFLGLVVTALNLMPVGQLDGGHIVHAMFGQRTGAAIGQIARFLVLGLALVQPGFWLWAIILFFMPIADEPALNDVTELDNKRDIIGLLVLALLVLIILPAPRFITNLLQI
jgi:membrane-associated protease RseP (regulator of RpoE activity)